MRNFARTTTSKTVMRVRFISVIALTVAAIASVDAARAQASEDAYKPSKR